VTTSMLLHGDLTESIIRCFFRSYNKLGPGFSEYVYALALQRELVKAGHVAAREVHVPVWYDGEVLARFRLDMIIDGLVVVETKAGGKVSPDAEHQVYSYLRSTNLEVGLLLHYGPRPNFRRYICTRDRKGGFDLRRGTVEGIPTDGAR
jgi:GxxExxY protein